MDKDFKEKFQYCSFCKISHKQKKKHVYSKKHQFIISRMLQKFSQKVKTAKMNIDDPEIVDISFEIGAKFWCYFCVDEYLKHLRLDVCTVKFGGVLEHISEDTHRTSVFAFLKDHRIDEEKQQAAHLLLSKECLTKFKQNTELKIRQHEARKKKRLEKESKHIAEEENKRRLIATSVPLEHLEPQLHKPERSRIDLNKVPTAQRKATHLAHGEGLTFIGTQVLGEDEGNVHMDALPPWLQTEEVNPKRSEIGPSLEDFYKHLEREKSKKLPAGRVGAKFDRSGSSSSQWLPSFGRVWNKGRRQQSEHFFRKEMGMKKFHTKPHTVTSETEAEESHTKISAPLEIKPYVKKRKIAEDNSNTEQIPLNGNDNQNSFKVQPYVGRQRTEANGGRFVPNSNAYDNVNYTPSSVSHNAYRTEHNPQQNMPINSNVTDNSYQLFEAGSEQRQHWSGVSHQSQHHQFDGPQNYYQNRQNQDSGSQNHFQNGQNHHNDSHNQSQNRQSQYDSAQNFYHNGR